MRDKNEKFFLSPRPYAFFILMSSLVIAALQWKKLKIEFPSLLQTWDREKIKTNPSVSPFRKGRDKKNEKNCSGISHVFIPGCLLAHRNQKN